MFLEANMPSESDIQSPQALWLVDDDHMRLTGEIEEIYVYSETPIKLTPSGPSQLSA